MTKPSSAPNDTDYWQRVGRDDSFYIVSLGPLGFGIPVWLGLVLLYLLLTLSAVAFADRLPPATANRIAGGGPAVLGLIDLVQRLRTSKYALILPNGMEVTQRAGLLDRLTYRECGWYLPILFVPLPLWLLGWAITVELLTT